MDNVKLVVKGVVIEGVRNDVIGEECGFLLGRRHKKGYRGLARLSLEACDVKHQTNIHLHPLDHPPLQLLQTLSVLLGTSHTLHVDFNTLSGESENAHLMCIHWTDYVPDDVNHRRKNIPLNIDFEMNKANNTGILV